MADFPLKTVPKAVEAISREIGDRLKELLESKHIYQRIRVNAEKVLTATIDSNTRDKDKIVTVLLRTLLKDPFFPHTGQTATVDYDSNVQYPTPTLIIRNVKLVCSVCDSVEAFAPVWFGDIVNEMVRPSSRGLDLDPATLGAFRLYYLVYQCQACKGEPEAFLVKRKGWDLFLEGRSPMEQVSVPAFIPKAERWLYRDAVVAMHGGKILAGLFYLRAFIETFARRVLKIAGQHTGDELMTLYGQTLPAKQRDLMPSTREWYAKLSEAIHSAREDADLFVDARNAIDKHFEIRRVFDIPEE